MKRTDQITGAIMMLLGSYVAWEASTLQYTAVFGRPGPGFFPLWLGLVAVLLGAVVLMNATINSAYMDEPARFGSFRDIVKPGLVLVAMIFAIVGLRVLGFLVTILLLLAFLTIVVGRARVVSGLVTSLAGSIVFYLVFQVWLKVQLPVGFLGI